MSEFKQYKRSAIAELRPVTYDEAITKQLDSRISLSQADRDNGSPSHGDMIARNPKNHEDQWLVAKQYFEDNFELVVDNSNEQLQEENSEATKVLDAMDSTNFESYKGKIPAMEIVDLAKERDPESDWDNLETNGWQVDYWFELTYKSKTYNVSGSALYGDITIELQEEYDPDNHYPNEYDNED